MASNKKKSKNPPSNPKPRENTVASKFAKMRLEVLSDALFSDGYEVAGIADNDISHDEFGFPVIRGKRIKGLIVEEVANLLFALSLHAVDLSEAAKSLCGESGALAGKLDQRSFRVPLADRAALIEARYSFDEIIEQYTTIRRQTAISAVLGTPKNGSLRAARTLKRGLVLETQIELTGMSKEELCLLHYAVAATRRGGANRTRGAGKIRLTLDGQTPDLTPLKGDRK